MTILGPYRPPHAPWWIGYVIGWTAAITTAARAVDYLTGPDSTGVSQLAVVERFGTPRQWGTWLAVGALALTVALASRRIGPLILAHTSAVLVYSWYGIALAQGVVRADDGIRFLVPVAANLTLNVICLVLLGREVRRAAGPPTNGGQRWTRAR